MRSGTGAAMSEAKKSELHMRDKAILHQQRRLKQATQFTHKDSADLLPLDGLKRLGTSKDLAHTVQCWLWPIKARQCSTGSPRIRNRTAEKLKSSERAPQREQLRGIKNVDSASEASPSSATLGQGAYPRLLRHHTLPGLPDPSLSYVDVVPCTPLHAPILRMRASSAGSSAGSIYEQPHCIVQRRLLESNVTRLRGETRDTGARVRSPLADNKEGAEAEEKSESTPDDSTEDSEKSLKSEEEEEAEEETSEATSKVEEHRRRESTENNKCDAERMEEGPGRDDSTKSLPLAALVV
ncbi:hypothetical protein Z043_117018 [Scleropages formosus]|uniref:Uncharacterized protein n=1 Tax=Scleropages formosus TaxID=113540 RepID=A0A0P7U3J0_SCLFO|nr:hypothetical protein Z043_117018 [Scleropages formosus]